MKPQRLVMSAFGSYAGVEVIDFEKAQQGVFLITGDTGSGKTTIFDAISYALYDKTSGEKREANMMRSQYASPDIPTFVELTFSYRNQIYQVKRNPEYFRESKRKNADGSKKFTKEITKVSLILPDGTEFPGNKKSVNQKIEEIIGLDVQQFLRIAMIAQGDFLKLLHANSDTRKSIFSKIFDTHFYAVIEEELKKRANEKLGQLEDGIRDCLSQIALLETQKDSEYKEKLEKLKKTKLPEQQETLALCSAINEKLEEQKVQLFQRKDELRKKRDSLKSEFERAEHTNQLLESLTVAREEYRKLKEEAPEIEELSKKIEKVERALQVRNSETFWIEAEKKYLESIKKIEKMQLWLEKNTKKIEEKKKKSEECELLYQQQFPLLQNRIQQIVQSEEVYKTLKELKGNLKKEQNATEKLEQGCQEALKKKETLQKKYQKIEKEQEQLQDSSLQAVQIEHQKKSLEKRISELEELEDRFVDYLAEEETWKLKLELYQKQEDKYKKASEEYENLYQAFFCEQAGILAKNLEEGEPCPVCGSISHPKIAVLSEGAPSQSQVEKARKAREKAEQQREEANKETIEARQSFQSKKSVIEEVSVRLLGEYKEKEEVSGILEKEKENLNLLCAKLKEANSNQKKYIKNQNDLSVNIQKCEEEQKVVEKLEKEIQELKTRCVKITQEIQTRQENLPYEDLDKALADKKKFMDILSEYKKNREESLDEYYKTRDEFTKVQGQLENERNNQSSLMKQQENTRNQYQSELIQNSLTEAEYMECKDEICKKEEWEKIRDKFRIKIAKKEESMRLLEEQGKGKCIQGLDELKKNIKEVESIDEEIQKQYQEIYGILEQNDKVKKVLEKYFMTNQETRKEYECLQNLSRTANGNLTGTMKLGLETYIQRRYFKKIVYAANQRLVRMSSGQFLLQCREVKALGTQGAVGLDLDIYSLVTDSTRDVKTLSGGESFIAALAMALGLSDVVQMSAGAVHIDTMFIDEGFGSLDEEARMQAIRILNELAGNSRMVGIISHVTELKEQIEKKLVVKKTQMGSKVSWS